MNIQDYIENLKGKPMHTRRQIAFGASFVFTALVAVAWLTTMTTSQVFALNSKSVENSGGRDFASVAKGTQDSFTELLGAASAFTGNETVEGDITTVGVKSSSTFTDTAKVDEDATVIPF